MCVPNGINYLCPYDPRHLGDEVSAGLRRDCEIWYGTCGGGGFNRQKACNERSIQQNKGTFLFCCDYACCWIRIQQALGPYREKVDANVRAERNGSVVTNAEYREENMWEREWRAVRNWHKGCEERRHGDSTWMRLQRAEIARDGYFEGYLGPANLSR